MAIGDVLFSRAHSAREAASGDYFEDALVTILADGDPAPLGAR